MKKLVFTILTGLFVFSSVSAQIQDFDTRITKNDLRTTTNEKDICNLKTDVESLKAAQKNKTLSKNEKNEIRYLISEAIKKSEEATGKKFTTSTGKLNELNSKVEELGLKSDSLDIMAQRLDSTTRNFPQSYNKMDSTVRQAIKLTTETSENSIGKTLFWGFAAVVLLLILVIGASARRTKSDQRSLSDKVEAYRKQKSAEEHAAIVSAIEHHFKKDNSLKTDATEQNRGFEPLPSKSVESDIPPTSGPEIKNML